ncbi:MAG TPA: amidohydrolase family protein [Candidatus Binatia bacterium]|nr:amidohydrolase family protein [Candidatus Binatia bacterium]
MRADLILVGRVRTGDRERPCAEAIAVRDGRIAALGDEEEILRLGDAATEMLGGCESAILPGFVDAHLHLLALARRAEEVDCSRESVRSVAELVAKIRAAAASRPPGSWIRAFGYDEFFLDEKRPPRMADLDTAAPAHAVRLLHRTGHAAVLNTVAFQRLGMAPCEVIYEPAGLLRGRIPAPSADETQRLVAAASERLLASGITMFHDPSPGQSADDIGRLRAWVEEGTIRQRVIALGAPTSFEASDRASRWFQHAGVKIMIGETDDVEEVAAEVAAADRRGAQIALHAVEGAPLVIAIEALRRLGPARTRARRHRIEHAALCPPALCQAIGECGAAVVTHPGFLRRFGDKYRSELRREEEDWLYPLRSLLESRVPLAFGSDAPIAPPSPLDNVAAALVRETERGARLGISQRILAAEALALHTRGGAWVGGLESACGSLAPGRLADLVVVDRDPLGVPPAEIAAIRVLATVIEGRVVWRREDA